MLLQVQSNSKTQQQQLAAKKKKEEQDDMRDLGKIFKPVLEMPKLAAGLLPVLFPRKTLNHNFRC